MACNNVWPYWLYNNRLQPAFIYAVANNDTSKYMLSLNYSWASANSTNNNGSVRAIDVYSGNAVPVNSLTHWQQAFSYDGLKEEVGEEVGTKKSGQYTQTQL